MKSGIYCIRNKIDNKKYIGSTANFHNRFSSHYRDLVTKRHKNKHLQLAWNKYESINFEFIILEYVEKEKLIEKEQECIDLYKTYINTNGYNLRPRAENNCGVVYSEETRRKIGLARKGKKLSEETKRRILQSRKNNPNFGKWNKGRKASEETRKRMSISRTGEKRKPCSLETKNKIAESLRGKVLSEEHKKQISIGLMKNGAWNKGLKMTEEAKKKSSESHKGKTHSDISKKKIGDAVRGRKHSTETIIKMCKPHKYYPKNRKKTIQTQQKKGKISKFQKGRKRTPETCMNISLAQKKRRENSRKSNLLNSLNVRESEKEQTELTACDSRLHAGTTHNVASVFVSA